MRSLLACTLLILFHLPSSYAGELDNLLAGRFLMCDTASQVAQYLTLVNVEDKTAQEAVEASGKNEKGYKVCGTGHWLYIFVAEHSKFNVGDGKFVINEIVVVGYIENGIGKPSKPVKQFGYGLAGPEARPVGFSI